MFVHDNANTDECTKYGKRMKTPRSFKAFRSNPELLEYAASTYVPQFPPSFNGRRQEAEKGRITGPETKHAVYKGNQSQGEDELINFNQTSIFKCWKMIT